MGPPIGANRVAVVEGEVLCFFDDGRTARADPDGLRWVENTWLIGNKSRFMDPGLAHTVHASAIHRGDVWSGTAGHGIWRKRQEPLFVRHAIPGASRVHALARAPDGAIWCGTENGIARVAGAKIDTFPAIAGKALGTVTACAVDRGGRVWIGSGSSFKGVYRLDGDGWKHLDEIDGFVHRITTDPSGALWFAVLNAAGEPRTAGRGAWYFSDNRFHPAPANVELPSARVYDVVARDPNGVLWFATLKGLAAYEGPERVTQYTKESIGLKGEKVWSLCAGRDGSLWIGYQGEAGVSRLARGQLTHFGTDDGLCDGEVWSIVEGRPGVFWFATQHGLARYDGRRWSCFQNEEGLGDKPIWPLLPLDDGSLWIGTLGDGLVHLTPRDTSAPRTRIEHAAGVARWQATDAWYDTAAAELRYRWRVDGGRWSSATATAELRLHAGTLEVQAIDRFGNAEDPPARLRIEAAATSRGWIIPLVVLGIFVLILLLRAGFARRAR